MVDAPKAWPDAPQPPAANIMTFDEIQEVTYFLYTAKYLDEAQYKHIIEDLEKVKQETIKAAIEKATRLRWTKRSEVTQ